MADDRNTEPTQLLNLLRKSQGFAEKLLTENEQLRMKLAAEEERSRAAEQERDALRGRMQAEEASSSEYGEHLADIEDELHQLANLHVAIWQLHSSLELEAVISVILEVTINLVGAREVVVYLHDEPHEDLKPVAADGVENPERMALTDPAVKAALETRQVVTGQSPVAAIPLVAEDRLIGAVVIRTLLEQKDALTDLDHELFRLLSSQGASALYAAYLAGIEARPLTDEAFRALLGR